MDTPISVIAVKDGMDWLLYAVSFLAAVTTIGLVLPWALERRRRPEVSVLWQVSMTVSPEQLEPWPADRVMELVPGQQILVAASFRNVGDRQGQATQVNLVVPTVLGIGMEIEDAARVEPVISHNRTAGLLPSLAVRYLNVPAPVWTAGSWFSIHFRLWVLSEFKPGGSVNTRTLFAIADPGFNGTGRRWLPSLLPSEESMDCPVGHRWPPKSSRFGKRRLRIIRAQPMERILCSIGERQDVRDIRIVPLEEPRP